MLKVHRINYPSSLCAGNYRTVAVAVGDVAALKLSITITIVEHDQMNNALNTEPNEMQI